MKLLANPILSPLHSISKRRVPIIVMALALAAASSIAQPQPTGTSAIYTTISDFSYGTLLNTTTALTPIGTTGQVQFSPTSKPFPYLYVAVSGRGTLVRIDINSGAILGEYFTAPNGNGRDPSRTTVDQLGNVWVSNRAEAGLSPLLNPTNKGSVTRIGLIVGGIRDLANSQLITSWTYSTCVDRDGDGKINTSSGLANIRAWPGGGAGGADTHGGVSTADDECIINYTRVAGTNARTVAIDHNNDLWVGGTNSKHQKLSGALTPNPNSGQPIMGTEFQALCGGYGGFIDKFGVLWSARYFQNPPYTGHHLLRFDPTVGGLGQCLNTTHGDYGLALDPKTCHVWHTTLFDGKVMEMDSVGTVLATNNHGFQYAQGVAVDGNSSVWVAHSILGGGATTVGHLKTSGLYVGNVQLVDTTVNPNISGSGPTGVSVDTNGKIWVTNLNSNNVMRIDPKIGALGGGAIPVGAVDKTVDLGPGAGPYNYSDMTGGVAISNPTQGFWNVVHTSLALGTSWGVIKWNTEAQASVPSGSSITMEARAADTQPLLTTKAFIPVTNGIKFNLTGKYIEMRASLKATANPGCVESASPILSDLRILTACDIDLDGDIDQQDLALISRARGQAPSPGDPRDANGDGLINAADVKACIPSCTRANCATQ